MPAKHQSRVYLLVLEDAEFGTDWEKVKIQQLGIDNEGKKPSEISYSQTQDIKTQRWNRIESSHCHYNQITNGGKGAITPHSN